MAKLLEKDSLSMRALIAFCLSASTNNLKVRIETWDFNERGINTQCGCNGPNNAVQIVFRYISVEHLQTSAKQPRRDTDRHTKKVILIAKAHLG